MQTKRDQFTLIELLIVVAVIMILLSILLPSLKNAYHRSLLISCKSQMKQQYLALNMYVNDFDDNLPDTPNSAHAAAKF